MPITFINPKLSFSTKNEQVHFAVGNFLAMSTFDDDLEYGGATYGTVTFGDRNNNLSLGVGLPYGSDGGFTDSPVIQIAGMGRLSDRVGIVGEALIGEFDGNFAGGTVNMRFINKKAVFDIGAAFAKDFDYPIPIASAALIF